MVPIRKGDLITRDQVSFHMPCLTDQLTSGEFGRYRVKYYASKDYDPKEPICEFPISDEVSSIRSIIHDVKGMLYEAQIVLGDEVEIELSHHYGIKQFRRTGAVIVNVVNRNYCKKLIVLLPGQRHPTHWHERKEETFQVLYGSMEVTRNGECIVLSPGEKMLVEPGVKHSFRSDNGVIFEEISTTHIRNDSFYEDSNIQCMDPLERKTLLKDW
jgi:N-acetylneuraminate synthase